MSTSEQRLLDAYDRNEMLDLARDLTRIPSFTTEETPVANHLARYLGQRGFAVELQEVEPGRLQCVSRMPGTGGGRSLMVNGHTDIDPLTVGWRRDPWEPVIEGDRLIVSGTSGAGYLYPEELDGRDVYQVWQSPFAAGALQVLQDACTVEGRRLLAEG